MSRALAVALLAQGALAAVNIHYMPDLPEVTPAPTAVEIPGVNQLANIAAAAAATDAPGGLEACADAENLIQFCVTEIPNFTKAANSVIAACMCCSRSSYVAPLYSSCKSYITASAPQYTNDYTLVSIASSLCTAQGRGICSATGLASGTASATASSRTARSSITAASRPAACSSFASIIQSCSRKDDDFLSQSGRQQASCICYSGRTYTTKFDDYASSCASWARTGLSSGYSDIAELSTFCEDYPASRTTSRGRGSSSDDDTTTAGSGGGGVGGSGGATTTPDNGPKSTVTVPPPTTTAPPRSPAARNAASGLVVLGAVFAGMLLA